jgi:hypothetical protein
MKYAVSILNLVLAVALESTIALLFLAPLTVLQNE